jgi:hypothetical protein
MLQGTPNSLHFIMGNPYQKKKFANTFSKPIFLRYVGIIQLFINKCTTGNRLRPGILRYPIGPYFHDDYMGVEWNTDGV